MNLVKRFSTATVLLILLYAGVVHASRLVFFLVVQAVVAAALVEFYNLARRRNLHPHLAPGIALAGLLGASFYFPGFPRDAALYLGLLVLGVFFLFATRTLETVVRVTASVSVTAFGAFYIAFPLNFFLPLRDEHGPSYLFFLFALIFIGDTGAFFVGKMMGRHRMAPIASPNKTWEGAGGGLLFAGLAAWGARALLLPGLPLGVALGTGIAVHAVAQAADPLESLFKRAAGVKDSSNALPGHGGFLDRIDSLLLAVPFFYFLVRHFWK